MKNRKLRIVRAHLEGNAGVLGTLCLAAMVSMIWWLWDDIAYMLSNGLYPLQTCNVVQTGSVS